MQSGLELWLSPTTGVLSHLHNNYTLSSIFFIFGPSGPGDHTTGSTALNLGMLHACFDQQGAAAISIVETGKTLHLVIVSDCNISLRTLYFIVRLPRFWDVFICNCHLETC